jgi:hypothetical protein
MQELKGGVGMQDSKGMRDLKRGEMDARLERGKRDAFSRPLWPDILIHVYLAGASSVARRRFPLY